MATLSLETGEIDGKYRVRFRKDKYILDFCVPSLWQLRELKFTT